MKEKIISWGDMMRICGQDCLKGGMVGNHFKFECNRKGAKNKYCTQEECEEWKKLIKYNHKKEE